MDFPGFEREDFEIFSVPDFAGRMGAIRSRLRPKLIALGEDLNPRVEETTGLPSFPHVAQHMRRRVNPPAETWVAFARDRKGYKRWTHYRVVVGASGVRVTVFVEDDADDKPQFGRSLQEEGARILAQFPAPAAIHWYTLDGAGQTVTAADLERLGGSLQRLKTLKFQAGVPLSAVEALKLGPAGFDEWAAEQIRILKPLYLAGAVGSRKDEG
jgi:uncharacterized protein YktB (UPF0637 family)